MDIYRLAIDDKLLIEGSVGLFFETWLLSHRSMSECGERCWIMGRLVYSFVTGSIINHSSLRFHCM
jgi:hypothetical protein